MIEITIKKVEKGTETAVALLEFVKNFSWDEVKEHSIILKFKSTKIQQIDAV